MLPLTFAVLTDVHANLLALDACLADVERIRVRRGLDALPVHSLGDALDSGPFPLETLRRVRATCVVSLLGNHESYLFDHHRNPRNARYLDPLWRFVPWTHALIPGPELEAFQMECRFRESLCGGKVHLFHASAESNGRNPAFFEPQDARIPGSAAGGGGDGDGDGGGAGGAPPLPERYVGEVDSLCFAGHNHYCGLHWDPLHGAGHGGALWVNAGSVGYPFVEKDPGRLADPVATYVIATVSPSARGRIHVDVEFRRVAHDGASLLRSFVDTGALFDCAPFAAAILCQCYFNEDVVYPFFRAVRARGWLQTDLPRLLSRHLRDSGYVARLRTAFESHSLAVPALIE